MNDQDKTQLAPEAPDGAPAREQTDDTTSTAAAEDFPLRRVSPWALHRRLYDWTLSFARDRHSTTALFGFSFAESSFFPIPPDVLLGPMCLGHRRKSWWFAFVTTVASVLGALLGYLIGYELIQVAVLIPGIEMGAETNPERWTVNWLKMHFDEHGDMYVFWAALTPIPFKLLTITSGFAAMNLVIFVAACVIGRGIRFFGVAYLFWLLGPKAEPLIDRHFNKLCLAFAILLVGGFLILKWLK